MPKEVIAICRKAAEGVFLSGKPKNYIAGGTIILIWILIMVAVLMKLINK